MGPFLARTVAVQLDTVVVGVAQVQGLRDAVVGGAVQGIPSVDQDSERLRQLTPVGVEDGEVEEARRAAWGGRDVAPGSGVKTEVVVVATSGEEDRIFSIPLGDLEA